MNIDAKNINKQKFYEESMLWHRMIHLEKQKCILYESSIQPTLRFHLVYKLLEKEYKNLCLEICQHRSKTVAFWKMEKLSEQHIFGLKQYAKKFIITDLIGHLEHDKRRLHFMGSFLWEMYHNVIPRECKRSRPDDYYD